MSHGEVVNLLREGSIVRLIVERNGEDVEDTNEIITVVLDKSKSSTIGKKKCPI